MTPLSSNGAPHSDDELIPRPESIEFSTWPDAEPLAGLRAAVLDYRDRGREVLSSHPLESLLALVFGGAAVYYLAERGRNEKVHHYWDALEFVSTCASVGYSNIFPNTPVGKIVASTLFLLGPTLTSRALDPPAVFPPVNEPPSDASAVVAKLEELLEELRRLNARAEGP
jgi:hypothetical protein